MKPIFYSFLVSSLLSICVCFAQNGESTEVNAKGIGVKRDDALQDALRGAVSQAAGVALSSETSVENFEVLRDAIITNTKGYIESYTVVKEGLVAGNYEVNIRAKVSLKPMKADFNLLTNAIGGVRFLVMYDPAGVKAEDLELYDFAVERVNSYLSSKRYRYIDKRRFDALKNEAMNMMEDDIGAGNISYVQQLGIMADAQFIIQVSGINITSRSEAFDTRTSSKVSIEVRAFDNCTAEGLGTLLLESDWKSSRDASASKRTGVEEAINLGSDKLMSTFTAYIGDWVNNGTPFEIRFYQSGTFRDFRELRNKLRNDKNFGGQLEIVNAHNFTKLNCTFRKRPDELADKLLDYLDEIPSFREQIMDVKFIYGRQISLAPQSVVIPTIKKVPDTDPAPVAEPEPAPKPQEKTQTAAPAKNSKNKNRK
ncbi:MAG: hypothetical protein ACK4ND_07305 [Cytophagaceae bacterium]